ncbi:MAG: O-methyltransferase [Lachnospiraceae bacterium]|nr:O-methyltransferase [Lachnospiraceae bacterium]
MISDERTETFIRSFDGGENGLLRELEKEAKASGVPIIRPAARSLLRLVIAAKSPERILEIGTATGFSAIHMCECAQSPVHVTTIEKYERRIEEAKKNIKRAGMEDRITLLEGDAEDILKGLCEEGKTYDLVFMDAAKAQYMVYFQYVLKMLEKKGILISDNVLQDGDVIESRFAVERRNRTIHSRMREYLYELTHNEELVTDILPVADGMTVSVRI